MSPPSLYRPEARRRETLTFHPPSLPVQFLFDRTSSNVHTGAQEHSIAPQAGSLKYKSNQESFLKEGDDGISTLDSSVECTPIVMTTAGFLISCLEQALYHIGPAKTWSWFSW